MFVDLMTFRWLIYSVSLFAFGCSPAPDSNCGLNCWSPPRSNRSRSSGSVSFSTQPIPPKHSAHLVWRTWRFHLSRCCAYRKPPDLRLIYLRWPSYLDRFSRRPLAFQDRPIGRRRRNLISFKLFNLLTNCFLSLQKAIRGSDQRKLSEEATRES